MKYEIHVNDIKKEDADALPISTAIGLGEDSKFRVILYENKNDKKNVVYVVDLISLRAGRYRIKYYEHGISVEHVEASPYQK